MSEINPYFGIWLGKDANGRWHWRMEQVRPIPPATTVNPSVHDYGESLFYRLARWRAFRAVAREDRYIRSGLIDWRSLGEGR